MQLIYIAGPYSAERPSQVRGNIERAREAAREVALAGGVPVTPHLLSVGLEDIRDEQWWGDATLYVLAACDAMVLLHGWQDSRGCVRELAYAGAAGLPVVCGGLDGADLRDAVERWLAATEMP
jgi:hypothetical protein